MAEETRLRELGSLSHAHLTASALATPGSYIVVPRQHSSFSSSTFVGLTNTSLASSKKDKS